MRDFASCFSEYAIQVSDTSCSSYTNTSCISPTSTPSIQNAVVYCYKTALSSHKHILTTLTWCKNSLSQGLNIVFGGDNNDTDPSSSSSLKINTNSRLFRKLKGSKSIEFQKFNIEVFWDLSNARYESGPEPVDNFYVFVTVDSELSLSLGNLSEEASIKKLKPGSKTAQSSLISRQEHFSGNALYSTKARFCDSGNCHEISIRCSDENEGLKYPVLNVCIDKKAVIRVKRLQWNFRGNQTIFLDGLLIDLMWDVHDWFYNPDSSGNAVFMFRTRSGFDSRLWMEEKIVKRDQEKVEFALVICACKSS